jgi:hypothetical protein
VEKGRYGIISVITVRTVLEFILISFPDPWCFDKDPDPRNTGPNVQVQHLAPVVG